MVIRLIPRLRRWAAALCGACVLQSAQAASSVMIWPVDPIIDHGERAAALWLENRGTTAVSLQVRVFGWSQSGTAENYQNQEQVLASPPLLTVPAGQRQLVRLMQTGLATQGREEAYRVIIDELPDSERAKDSGGNSMGVQLQIRYSIPLFVYGQGIVPPVRAGRSRDPAAAARPELRWRTQREGNTDYLVLRNTGDAHARLTAVRWVRDGQGPVINPGLLGYVLAGSEMRWPLETPPPAGHAPEARVNGAETAQVLQAQ